MRISHLEWIESFVLVVDHGGFSAAAEAGSRSQSRVSAHIASLERALGASLLDRRQRPAALTSAGHAFLPHARSVLADIDQGRTAVDQVRNLVRGQVSLGSYPSASASFLPAVLKSFHHSFPEVRVDLAEMSTLGLADALAAGDIDIAVRARLPVPECAGFRERPLWSEWLVAVLPEGHPLAAEATPLALEALAPHPIVTIGRGHTGDPVRFEVHEAFRQRGLRPEIVWQTDQPQTLMNLVRSGFGVGVTNQLAAEVSDTSSLVVARVGERSNGREVSVFWDERHPPGAAARALLREILAAPRPEDTCSPFSAPGAHHPLLE